MTSDWKPSGDKPAITAWLPDQDQHRLAVLGKLIEECNELSGRAARCILHGLDEVDPDSGRTNRAELEREIADVEACLSQAQKRLGVAYDLHRAVEKTRGFDHWHNLIDEADHA
jgi:hypothetical protein